MGMKGKIEVEFEVNCHCDILHEVFGSRPHHVSSMSPLKVHGCDVHEGEFGKPGSVICWDYTHNGKRCVAKELIETMDEENKLVRFKVIEGDLLDEFKIITIVLQVISNEETNGVKWTVEFEKIHDDGHYPTKFMDLLIEVTKDIENHHINAAA
ncbi:MLP-like protein 31 [Bienertia sinuspersici]